MTRREIAKMLPMALAIERGTASAQGPTPRPPGLPLEQFEPRSMLHVKETPVPRPRFPVIDFHTHVTWSGELSGEDEVTFKCDSPPRCCRGTARVGSTSRPNGSPAARHSTGTGRPSIRRCGQPSAAGVGRPATNCLRSGFLSECSPRSGHRSCARSPWLWAAG